MLDLLKEICRQSNIRIKNITENSIGFVVNDDFLVKKRYLQTVNWKDDIIAELKSVKNKKLVHRDTRS